MSPEPRRPNTSPTNTSPANTRPASTLPAGLILAGGKSRRLGRDKVVQTWQGATLLERTVALARRFCEPVYISGRNPSAEDLTRSLDAPWLPDCVNGVGPLAGILTGLMKLNRPLMTLACDLPLLDDATLQRLTDAWRARPEHALMTTFLQRETGYIEALVAIYEPEAIPVLQASLEQGCFKLSQALPTEMRHHIPYSQDEADVFFNINYPADLALLQRMMRSEARDASETS